MDPYWSPSTVDWNRRFGTGLMQQGTDASPVGHWTQALARALQGGIGGYMTGQANRADAEGKQGVADIYKQGLDRGDGMNKIAAALMGNPWGAEQGQSLANQHMTTQANQGFQRQQQAAQFAHAQRMQDRSFGQQRTMAGVQTDEQIRLAREKAIMDRQELMEKARALGLAPPEQAAPPQTVNGWHNNDPALADAPAPRPQPMAPTPQPQAMMPSDPYQRLTTPALSPEQQEADRKKRAGQTLLMGDAKGAARIINKEEDPKEYQTKDALFAERMARAEIGMRGIIGTPDQPKYNPGSKANAWWPDSGFVANMTNSQTFRGYQGSAREWIAALLRKDTGAAVTQTEWDFYWPTFFPQPGDSKEVQAQKLQRRVMAAQGLRGAAGPAFDRMYPGFDQEMRNTMQGQVMPGQAPQQSSGGDMPTVASPADAARLPKGTRFRDPEGNIRVVP